MSLGGKWLMLCGFQLDVVVDFAETFCGLTVGGYRNMCRL
jgi:hypothetical protein